MSKGRFIYEEDRKGDSESTYVEYEGELDLRPGQLYWKSMASIV